MDAWNVTRKWLGDVIFFLIWLSLMVVGIIGSTDPDTELMISRPFMDAFGFTAPVIGSVNDPVSAITIGGATNTNTSLAVDAWQGLTHAAYVQARVFWVAVAASIAALAGLIWTPVKPASQVSTKNDQNSPNTASLDP